MKKYAVIDSSDFPLVKVVFTGEQPDKQNFALYLQEVKDCYSPEEKLAIVFDAAKAVLPGLTYQKMQADWLKENTSLMQNYCQGTAYVIPATPVRKVLQMIFTLQRQPVPWKVVKTVDEAKAWAMQQLK